MCRNIKPLANFEPPATQEEVWASALQYVRKISGSARPSMHMGLANTRARLEQLYGEKHELALSTDAQGTVARVVIPFCSEPRLQR